MNQSIWRLLLTCLLLLALPLKGVAAVGMVACGTSHHRMDGSATAPAQMVATSTHEDVHGHDAADRHEASGKSSHHMGHSAQTADSADVAQAAGGDMAKVKCGGCAPCSMGAALTGAAIVCIPALPDVAELPAIESHYLSVDVVGFERPPRITHA